MCAGRGVPFKQEDTTSMCKCKDQLSCREGNTKEEKKKKHTDINGLVQVLYTCALFTHFYPSTSLLSI